ncbi:mucin-2-like isoform X1 [Macrobrachium rosenbergii]|uniref:mucin-2-like isoform X1 n=2 Tax=Macrobrachium rosenbergii TaxID=79674 RepID=UPI0034D65CE5
MAALDDSLTHFEGQKWSFWAERLGMNSPTSDSEDDENNKSRRESTTTRLKKEEMPIYGYCPRWEDFYLVVCDVCGHAIKPQALKQHIELRHGGVATPVKSSGGTRASVSGSKTSKTRNRTINTNPVVKIEGRIDDREPMRGSRASHMTGDSETNNDSHVNSSCNSSNVSSSNSRLGSLPTSPVCDLLQSPVSLPQLKTEVKAENVIDMVPPPQSLPTSLPPPAPPEPQHTMPHPSPHTGPPPSVGPPSIGPPSVGPPSVGPPSIGPPSVGPPSVGPPSVSCPSVTHQGMTTMAVPSPSLAPTAVAGVSMSSQSTTSVEEEVNKISAMLQAEAEALAASQSHLTGSTMEIETGLVGSHDIVEAQGLAGCGLTTSGSNLQGPGLITSSHPLGSVPVPIGHMSMATLNQIQADLLATVSESDLNAVLNATPDSSQLAQTVLPSNSHQCYLNDNGNMTYIDQQSVNTENYVEPPHLSNQNVLPQQYNSEQLPMPVLEQITSEVFLEAEATAAASSAHNLQGVSNGVQGQYTNTTQSDLIEVPVDSFSFDEIEKISSHCDELTNAVNSITQLCQSGNTGLESQLAGLLQQPASTPAPSPSPGAPGMAGNSVSAAPAVGTNTTSQGITVVIGAGTQAPVTAATTQPSLSMPTLAATLKKPVVSSSGPSIVSPGPTTSNATPSQTPTHTPTNAPTTPTQHTSTGTSTVVPTTQTPSPKKSSKKKKPGERKLLPLKDREYDAEVHCGVLVPETGKPCTRSLTCKTHSLTLRRNVVGRSKKFDELLLEHRAAKEAQTRAAKPPDAAASLIQGTPPRGSSVATTGSGGMVIGGAAATSPLLVKTLGGPSTTVVTPSDPSPNPTLHHHPMDPPSTPSHIHATPPSPAYWQPPSRIVPALVPADNFYVREPPKPLATCTYNCRRLGGYLATDHRMDLLRNAFRNALKKPHPGSVISDSSISNTLNIGGTQERFVNVKPLLAKKLQLTVPSGSGGSKDGISVSTGYNGHIHVSNSIGIVNNAIGATLKRSTQPDPLKNTAAPMTSAKGKNKKIKTSDGAINIVGNVLQLDASGNKNHIPVVVSLQNGLSNTQTLTLSNVAAIAGVRNSTTQPIRINPSTNTTFVRDAQVTDSRPGSTSENANIVLGSGLPSGSIVISDALAKSFKSDGSGSIRLELHSNTFGDASRLVTNTAKVSASGVTTSVGSGGGISGGSTVGAAAVSGATQGLPPGQVTYLTPAVPGSGATTSLTFHQVQQVLNRLQVQGKSTAGTVGAGGGGLSLKLLGSGQSGVTGARSTYVLQQEKEPS